MTDIDVDRYQGPLREATPSGHVGFDSLPDQVVNKATGAGFCFNILCVGETGIGKRYLSTNFTSVDLYLQSLYDFHVIIRVKMAIQAISMVIFTLVMT